MHPARVVLDAAPCVELVGTDADVIDTDDVGHLLYALDVLIEAREEVPDADRTAGLGDGPRVVGADLPLPKRRRAHGRRSGQRGMGEQQWLRRDFDRLLRHLLCGVREIADKAEPMAGP